MSARGIYSSKRPTEIVTRNGRNRRRPHSLLARSSRLPAQAGRVSGAALTVVPAAELDVRVGRPPAPERLSDEERELWQRLTFSRRPGWFSGAEAILESYVTTVSQVQRLEAALRKAK